VATVILLTVTIAVCVAFAGMMYGWFGGASSIIRFETSGTRVILRSSDGYCKILLSIRNLGTGAVQMIQITVDTDQGASAGVITFSHAAPSRASLSLSGSLSIVQVGYIYTTTGVPVDSSDRLIIPAGASATILFEIPARLGANKYWTIGQVYHGTFQYVGGAYDFSFTVEAY